jgi:hypothetical protein
MMGPLDSGYTQGLDAYFRKEAPAAVDPPPPARPPPPVLTPVLSPLPTPPPGAPVGAPPPLPVRPLPTSGPEARLAEAVRRLRLEPDAPPARAPEAPAPPASEAAPPELIVEVVPDADADAEFGPRIEAMLDGLDRIGLQETTPLEVVRIARLSSAMMRLMLRKGLVTEDELVREFVHNEGAGPRRT